MARHHPDQTYLDRIDSIRRVRNSIFGCPVFVIGTQVGKVYRRTMPDTQLGHRIAGWDHDEWTGISVLVTVRWFRGDYRIINIERMNKK